MRVFSAIDSLYAALFACQPWSGDKSVEMKIRHEKVIFNVSPLGDNAEMLAEPEAEKGCRIKVSSEHFSFCASPTWLIF